MSRKNTIVNRMKQLGITHKQIAHYSGLSEHTFNLWLDAKAVLTYNKLLRIAHLLDLEPDDLLEIV